MGKPSGLGPSDLPAVDQPAAYLTTYAFVPETPTTTSATVARRLMTPISNLSPWSVSTSSSTAGIRSIFPTSPARASPVPSAAFLLMKSR
jgi:hypothetical protein